MDGHVNHRMSLTAIVVMLVVTDLGSCSDVHMEISPSTMSRFSPPANVTLSCSTTINVDDGQEVLALEIRKHDGAPIAVLRQCSDLSSGAPANDHVHIDGKLERNANDNHLTVTIMNPTHKDMGSYSCLVVTIEAGGNPKQETVTGHLTFDTDADYNYFANKITGLEDRLSKAENTINGQNALIEAQATQLTSNWTKLNHLEQMSMDHASSIDAMVRNYKHMESFSAAYNYEDTFVTGGNIVFRDVLTRHGNGYDENTGIFTAQASGYFAFTLFATSKKTGVYYNIDVKLNSISLATLFAYGSGLYADQSSVSCFAFLHKGDKVRVVVTGMSPNTNTLHVHSLYSVFMGYLVKAD